MSETQPTTDVADLLSTMQRAVREERRRVVDEQQAFEAFRKRLTNVSVNRIPSGGESVLTTSSSAELVAVRDAYEETVMSVPHYAEDYNDTYAENVCTEFGPDVAMLLTEGTVLESGIKRELVRKAGECRQRRADFVETLDVERRSLSEVRDQLPPIADELRTIADQDHSGMGFGELDSYRARLRTLRDQCESIARQRQATIDDQRHEFRIPGDVPDLPKYLYAGLADDYPVLAAIARITTRIESTRSDIERAMATC